MTVIEHSKRNGRHADSGHQQMGCRHDGIETGSIG